MKESIILYTILDMKIDTTNTQARATNSKRVLVENVATRRGVSPMYFSSL